MKHLLVLSLVCLTGPVSAQIVGGTLPHEGRKMVTQSDFTLPSSREGYAVYQLAVNREGNVTGAKLMGTDLKSTPLQMKIRDHLMEYKFQPGTYYPKHHHVDIKITLVPKREGEPIREEN